ncbi:FAD-dependent oxidoreductase [Aestuariivita sp.]|jgi:predicted NAD/FAD-binding protein|uniref:NAD(P)/FAD-dependent oxidoreductase n=1 Tax=Aestuariivita sp. TaxID=1872407 RepID=UPI00216FCA84|nr:FAD-dependent oxidoreductase [Aestuariivita sp.]MCE8009011.1 NAD(P)-binding protein [Aestuariivita sp.]
MASIAVIGSGISGNAAAWALHSFTDHKVTLYEKRLRPGGHSASVDITHGTTPITVDTGFIVYNGRNYPDLTALFDHLGVATEWSDMSFGVSVGDGALEWCGDTLDALFAQRKNLVSPRFLSMLRAILRFNKTALADLESGALSGLSLAQYLAAKRYPTSFVEDYLVPMGAAIWSTPDADIMAFPAQSFVRFFANHRLLDLRPPEWRTVSGGSRNYVRKLTQPLGDRMLLGRQVTQVRRVADAVQVTDATGETRRFDYAIMAAHSDQTLGMLGDASDAEGSILADIRYRPNDVYLHRDEALMPKRKKVWAAWNYISSGRSAKTRVGVSVSYWMNKLQNIDKATPLFITLNPASPPDPDKVFLRTVYDHPQFDAAALEARKRLPDVQGTGRIWFAGAWTGYGFHEDGLRSGLEAAQAFGAGVPWRVSASDPVVEQHRPVAQACSMAR